MRRSPRKRRQETRRLACAQEDTESEDETYLSAATKMQNEVRLYSFTDSDDEIISHIRTVTCIDNFGSLSCVTIKFSFLQHFFLIVNCL